jgi:hypothetical protein
MLIPIPTIGSGCVFVLECGHTRGRADFPAPDMWRHYANGIHCCQCAKWPPLGQCADHVPLVAVLRVGR